VAKDVASASALRAALDDTVRSTMRTYSSIAPK
jgi:hypothetical protein